MAGGGGTPPPPPPVFYDQAQGTGVAVSADARSHVRQPGNKMMHGQPYHVISAAIPAFSELP